MLIVFVAQTRLQSGHQVDDLARWTFQQCGHLYIERMRFLSFYLFLDAALEVLVMSVLELGWVELPLI